MMDVTAIRMMRKPSMMDDLPDKLRRFSSTSYIETDLDGGRGYKITNVSLTLSGWAREFLRTRSFQLSIIRRHQKEIPCEQFRAHCYLFLFQSFRSGPRLNWVRPRTRPGRFR